MKNLLIIAVVALLGVNILFACGGMSPAPAPADASAVVPDLPSSSTDLTTTPSDNSNGTSDQIGTCTDGTALENVATELNDLSNDLPQNQVDGQNADGTFVATVL